MNYLIFYLKKCFNFMLDLNIKKTIIVIERFNLLIKKIAQINLSWTYLIFFGLNLYTIKTKHYAEKEINIYVAEKKSSWQDTSIEKQLEKRICKASRNSTSLNMNLEYVYFNYSEIHDTFLQTRFLRCSFKFSTTCSVRPIILFIMTQ